VSGPLLRLGRSTKQPVLSGLGLTCVPEETTTLTKICEPAAYWRGATHGVLMPPPSVLAISTFQPTRNVGSGVVGLAWHGQSQKGTSEDRGADYNK
jgi:hypothetical protein